VDTPAPIVLEQETFVVVTPEPEEKPAEETPTPAPEATEVPVARSAQINVEAPDNPQLGDTVTLSATLIGYENTIVSVRWQYSTDEKNWVDATGSGADTTEYSFQISSDNQSTYWRLAVTEP